MKQILMPQIKKWMVLAVIGVTMYFFGYFVGTFIDGLKHQEPGSQSTENPVSPLGTSN